MDHGGVRRTALGHFVSGCSEVLDDISRMWRDELYSLSAFAIDGYLARDMLLPVLAKFIFVFSLVYVYTAIRCTARMYTLSLVRYRGE